MRGYPLVTGAVVIPAAAALVISAACHSTPTDLVSSVGVIYGTVVDSNRAPVPDVLVQVFTGCDAPPDGALASGVARSVGDGSYGVLVQGPHVAESNGCFAVVARPPAGAGLENGLVTEVRLTLRSQALTPPVDSTRVDFVLNAMP